MATLNESIDALELGLPTTKTRIQDRTEYSSQQGVLVITRYDLKAGTAIGRTYSLPTNSKEAYVRRSKRFALIFQLDLMRKSNALWILREKKEQELNNAVESSLWSTERLERLARGN